MNRDTEQLYYNTYLVIDANVLTEPRVWLISKINRTNSLGVVVFTCAQEIANQHTLKADYDEDGNVIAWWADWKESDIPPTPAILDEELPSFTILADITPSAHTNQIRVGGTKTFTLRYFDDEENLIEDYEPGEWTFTIDGEDATDLVTTTIFPENPFKIRIKFKGDDSYIGKILTITNTSDITQASVDIEIIAL